MRYLLFLEYDGTDFCGWQRQGDGNSVHDAVCDAWRFYFPNEEINPHASGRTDAGVHALMQPVQFDSDCNLDAESVLRILNTSLREGVSVRDCKIVPEDFHARISAKSKTYLYRIYCGKTRPALDRNRVAWVKEDLDIDKMISASKGIIGEHDFSAFCARGTAVKSFVRTVYDIKIEKVGDEIHFRVHGSGFLYNMVRIIVGTLVYVGYGKLQPSDVAAILKSKDRTKAGKTMPACGLYLENVEYTEFNETF